MNSEYTRLGHPSTEIEELQRQYSQLLKFYDTVTPLTLFSPDQKEKLCCYHVSTLIGAANVCGIRRDNTTQITYLEQALSIIRTMGNDVQDPYSTGQNFYVKTINDLCKNKIQRTGLFSIMISKGEKVVRDHDSKTTFPHIIAIHPRLELPVLLHGQLQTLLNG